MFTLQLWEFGTEQHLKLVTTPYKQITKDIETSPEDSEVNNKSLPLIISLEDGVDAAIEDKVNENSEDGVQNASNFENTIAKDNGVLVPTNHLKHSKTSTGHHHQHSRTITIAVNDEPIDMIKTTFLSSCHKLNCSNYCANGQTTDCMTLSDSCCPPPATPVSKRVAINLIILGFSFGINLANIRIMVPLLLVATGINNSSVFSLGIFYCTAGLSTLFVSRKSTGLSAKTCMIIGTTMCVVWHAGAYHPVLYLLIPAAAIFGIGHTILWNGQLVYFADTGFGMGGRCLPNFAHLPAHRKLHFNILSLVQLTQLLFCVCSSLLLKYFVKKSGKSSYTKIYNNCTFLKASVKKQALNETTTLTISNPISIVNSCKNSLCGLNFSINILSNVENTADKSYSTLILIFVGMTVLALFLIAFGLDKTAINIATTDGSDQQEDCCQENMFQTGLNNIKEGFQSCKRILLLLPIILISGYGEGFLIVDMNRAFIGCSFGMENIGYGMALALLANIFSYGSLYLISVNYPRASLVVGLFIASVLFPCVALTLYFYNPILLDPSLSSFIPLMWGCYSGSLDYSINAIVLRRIVNSNTMAGCFLLMRSLRLIGGGLSCGFTVILVNFRMKLVSFIVLHAVTLLVLPIDYWRQNRNSLWPHTPNQCLGKRPGQSFSSKSESVQNTANS